MVPIMRTFSFDIIGSGKKNAHQNREDLIGSGGDLFHHVASLRAAMTVMDTGRQR